MNLTATGTVIATDTQKGTSKAGREWQKKVFVIEFMEGTSTRHLAFDLFGDDRINSNPFKKGQTVTVYYDINATEWNGRWFTQCSAWKVEPFDPKQPATTAPTAAPVEVPTTSFDDFSGLPF